MLGFVEINERYCIINDFIHPFFVTFVDGTELFLHFLLFCYNYRK